MDENWLQAFAYDGPGFKILMAFQDWRVAVLNYLDEIHPQKNDRLERHMETDEIFVLLKGHGMLIIGGNDAGVEQVHAQVMEPGTAYNVRRATWHTALLSPQASVLIVEQRDTGEGNSEYFRLSPEQHRRLIELSRLEEGLL